MIKRIEFTREDSRYRAQVMPWPVDSRMPSFWYVSVDDGPGLKLFEAVADDACSRALEGRIAAAVKRLAREEHRGHGTYRPYDPPRESVLDVAVTPARFREAAR